MSVLRSDIRRGAYHDSIVLMQLQAALADLPGVMDAAVAMGGRENLAILETGGMLPETAGELAPEDLLVVVRAEDDGAASKALARVDELLSRRGSGGGDEYRPRSLASALAQLPDARVAIVSVPGRFAARVAREALGRDLHVFLYSDNVPLADEVALKTEAASRGRLLMGPDCGTALLNGVGLGFANRVRRGPIGLVGASGTGIQAVTCGIHALGGGVSHAIGTGGRDLSREVGGITTLQALSLLARDPDTQVIVLVSKPPDPEVADVLLDAVRESDKPVVIHFPGGRPQVRRVGPVRHAHSLGHVAALAVRLSRSHDADEDEGAAGTADGPDVSEVGEAEIGGAQDGIDSSARWRGPRHLRGLFSGGTLAYEALNEARDRLAPLHSNVALEGVALLADPARSRAHTILDLGSDEFTIGRLHPMMDNTLRLQRIVREAQDPDVGLILFDVVLGDGAHPDPAGELSSVVEAVRDAAGPELAAIVVGTDEDPQELDAQVRRLTEAGARVFRDTVEAVRYACRRLGAEVRSPDSAELLTDPDSMSPGGRHAEPSSLPEVDLELLRRPVAAISVGVEAFFLALRDQGASAVHVDWRPPAGGDDRLMGLLEKMRS